jgi:pyrophosphate--fructose-6-phosphate 1-phosphotransferase
VGVLFSGGQAPGGHNVIAGLFDALKAIAAESSLIGFQGGPSGLIAGSFREIDARQLASYRNSGGFDLLGSDRTKLTAANQKLALKQIEALKLDGLVIIGGDDSNTNAAYLAEYLLAQGNPCCVAGIPKTIDGDLKSHELEIPFGFDSAAKTFAAQIGNVARDALSAQKYTFFIKLMGRSASWLTLECALQTHPNCALIGEQIQAEGMLLTDVVMRLSDLIAQRAALAKHYGVILIPEGVLEFMPDCQLLLKELATLDPLIALEQIDDHLHHPDAKRCFSMLPKTIKRQLLLDRDPHGNLQLSKIETERLLIDMCANELKRRAQQGSFQGKFNPQPLFFGYEGRSCAPSNFDASYCYALGYVAAALINNRLSGYMATLKQLAQPIECWQPRGLPLTALMAYEERQGEKRAVIGKALVDLQGTPFAHFKAQSQHWALDDDYRYPAPIQYFGPPELTDSITCILAMEQASLAAAT